MFCFFCPSQKAIRRPQDERSPDPLVLSNPDPHSFSENDTETRVLLPQGRLQKLEHFPQSKPYLPMPFGGRLIMKKFSDRGLSNEGRKTLILFYTWGKPCYCREARKQLDRPGLLSSLRLLVLITPSRGHSLPCLPFWHLIWGT